MNLESRSRDGKGPNLGAWKFSLKPLLMELGSSHSQFAIGRGTLYIKDRCHFVCSSTPSKRGLWFEDIQLDWNLRLWKFAFSVIGRFPGGWWVAVGVFVGSCLPNGTIIKALSVKSSVKTLLEGAIRWLLVAFTSVLLPHFPDFRLGKKNRC